MPKLTQTQKADFQLAIERARDHGIRIFYDRHDTGLTIAVAPAFGAVDYKNKKTAMVSIAMCHSADSFKKKIGATYAVERMMLGESVLVPLQGRDMPELAADMARAMFGGFLEELTF